MRIKVKNSITNAKVESKPSRKLNSINYPEPIIEPCTAKSYSQKLNLNQMPFASRNYYEKIKNEYDQIEYPTKQLNTSKNVKPILTNRSNSNMKSQQSGGHSSRKFRQTQSQQHIEVLGSNEHLKDKLNKDVLCFFDQHRKSAFLIGNTKYNEKSPEHYLHDYFENDPQFYDDLDKQKTINKSLNFNEESNLNETFHPHHYNYQEIYNRNHENCHHIQNFKPSELKLAPNTSTQQLLQERKEVRDIHPGCKTTINHSNSSSHNFMFAEQNAQPISPISYSKIVNNESNRVLEEVNSSARSKRILIKSGHGKSSSVQLNNGSPSHYKVGPKSPGNNIKTFYKEKNTKETITRVKSNMINDQTIQNQIENETIYKRAVERILEKSHKNIDLTPIPKKRNIKNHIEKSIYFDAERTAVMLRKIEYSENLKSWKTDLIKQYSGHLFTELIIESQIIRIQRWWRKTQNYLFRKNPKIVKIQAIVQGYLFRIFCLSRIKSLIKFTHIDEYFKLRNAKICLGILAVNYARLFRRNFLKVKANKIISLLRRFKNKKRRLLNSMTKILTKHIIVNAKKSFRKLKQYDRASQSVIKIQRAVRKMLAEKKLIKRFLNSYDRRLNPLVPIYMWNRKKGFQSYMNKKRTLLGFCTTKFREALRRRRLKAFANVVEYFMMKANKRLYLPYFFDKAKSLRTSHKKRKEQSAFLKKILPKLNQKNKLVRSFRIYRRQIWMEKLKKFLTRNLFSKIISRCAFNPLKNELNRVRRLKRLDSNLNNLIKINQVKTFKQLKSYSQNSAAKSKLLKKIVLRKHKLRLRRAFDKWKNKSMFWRFYAKYNTKLIVLTEKLRKIIFEKRQQPLKTIIFLNHFIESINSIDKLIKRTHQKHILAAHQLIKKRCEDNLKKDFKKKRVLKKTFIKLFFTLKDKLLIYFLRWKSSASLLKSSSAIENISKRIYQGSSEKLVGVLKKISCSPLFNKLRLNLKFKNESKINEVLEYRIVKFECHKRRLAINRFHTWLNKSKRIYYNSMIVRLQRVIRIYLLYVKMKTRALLKAHEDWENYLEQLKCIKISLKNTVCIITGFGVYDAFQRIKDESLKKKREKSLVKMVLMINYQLRITFHKCFLNYKQLKSTILDRRAELDYHINSPSFKDRFIRNFLRNKVRYICRMKSKSDKVEMQRVFGKIKSVLAIDKVIIIQSKYRQVIFKKKFYQLKNTRVLLRKLFRSYMIAKTKCLGAILKMSRIIKKGAFRCVISALNNEASLKALKSIKLHRFKDIVSKKILKLQQNFVKNLAEIKRLSLVFQEEMSQVSHERTTKLRNLIFKKDKATYNTLFTTYFNWKLQTDANSIYLSAYTIKLYLKGYWIKKKLIDFCFRIHKLRFIKGMAELKRKRQLKKI